MGGSSSLTVSPLPRGKTVIITGGNTGIGYETAKSIAMMGASVILAVRTEQRGQSAIQKIDEEYQRLKSEQSYDSINVAKLDVEYRVCDLSSLKSTMRFVEWFKSTGRSLNVLICNGCTYALQEVMTEDNFEATYQVTYLSHFLLVSHLLPIMQRSGDDCRVVLVSSQSHRQAVFDPVYAAGDKVEKYDGFQCFANSNMFQIMYMYSLDKVLEKSGGNVVVMCVHRGKLDALAFPNDPRSQQGYDCQLGYMKCCGRFTGDAIGGQTVVYAALDPRLKGQSRVYLVKPRVRPDWPSGESRKWQLQNYLWKCTINNLREYLTQDVLQNLHES